MFQSAEFWVAVGFVIFVAVVIYTGSVGKVTGTLDARARRIASELADAARLRQEAEALLSEYEQKRSQAEAEAEAIVASAQAEAQRVAEEARTRIADFVKRRTAAAEARIAQAEMQATTEVRAAAADAAARVSEIVLRQEMRGPAAQDLVSRSLSEIKTKLRA